MKVLFGISNDNTVKGIVQFYEEKYGEKLEYKNVYYFKQFIQELAKGEYDRAIMLEELEKFPTNNYAQIDDYLFKIIDNVTDTYDSKNLIYIASDRRKLGDEFLSKLFNLGIYTVLTGQDRTKGKVTAAINKPYLKKDVKKYYDNVSSENVYSSTEVSELEIQRIITYYKNQNGNTERYSEIFDRIAAQYTADQLRIIINFLPNDVRTFLQENNEKYKSLLVKIEPVPIQVIKQEVKEEVPQQQSKEVKSEEKPKTEVKQNDNKDENKVEIKIEVKQEYKKPKEILSKENDAKVIEIKKEPDIIKQIVVKQAPVEQNVVTQVLEKEVIKSVYEVPKDYKKAICFVGAPKVGTTFCINAIATTLAKRKVKTAIVDVTRKRDTYTIYTYDNSGKRGIAAESLRYASNGMNEPLIYEKLSIYTAMPGEDRKMYNASVVLDTIKQHNNIILIDADFSTPIDYFKLCEEIYLVQDMNVLNINQITMFLRELKSRGVAMNKIKVIINKHVKCALTAKDLIDGIATYTSYDLKMYDELFNSSNIPYYILPFDVENYKKYIEMVYKYSNKFATFSEDFQENLKKIMNTIYPTEGGVNVQSKTYTTTSKKKGIFGRK